MKKNYSKLDFEVIIFDQSDVITYSNVEEVSVPDKEDETGTLVPQ